MRLVDKALREGGLGKTAFDDAYSKAVSLYEDQGIEIEQSDRIKLCAALSYRCGKELCDLGSYINIYPVVLALLGMKVTTVDFYPQKEPDSYYYDPSIDTALDIYRSVGINVIESDLYDIQLPSNGFDIVTSFETFEHLWHSPRPVMEKVVDALRSQGDFVLSVPNIARLGNRVKAVLGQSVLQKFSRYYETGYPFTGHRREMTAAEVDWMMRAAGLTRHSLFLASIFPPLGENPTFLGRVSRLAENKLPMPRTLKSQVFARYFKP